MDPGSPCLDDSRGSASLLVLAQEETEAPEHLCLCPAMHGNVVPPEQKPPGAERAVALLPGAQLQQSVQNVVQSGEASMQQHGQIDALGVVVEFVAVNR